MARAPNEKAAKAEALYHDGMKLVDIAEKLGVPSGTVRRWKSTYNWEGQSKKKQNERSDNRSERSERTSAPSKASRGGQIGNTNALKNGTYATEYWKHLTREELEMLNSMPDDEEFQLIETLRLATLREHRHMELLSRYRELVSKSPDGMVLREQIQTLTKEMNASGQVKSSTAVAQQSKVDGIEQMQIIEAELTRIQRVKVKTIEALGKIRAKPPIIIPPGDSENGEETTETRSVNIYLPDNGRN